MIFVILATSDFVTSEAGILALALVSNPFPNGTQEENGTRWRALGTCKCHDFFWTVILVRKNNLKLLVDKNGQEFWPVP